MQDIITLKIFIYFHISETTPDARISFFIKEITDTRNHCSLKNTLIIGLFKSILIHGQKRHSKDDTAKAYCIFSHVILRLYNP